MNSRHILLAGVGAAVTVVLTLFVAPYARSQINASPALAPIGASSSGNTSTVWFHEPHSRIVVACQTAAGQGSGLSNIQCVTTKLP
jgi:hypothetical protein